MLAKSGHRVVSHLGCVNNLKQMGLAYLIWAGDNGDVFPIGTSLINGGSMELVATGNVVQTFQVMSYELSLPKTLFCPQDSGRIAAKDFARLANSNLSYFVGVDATNAMNPRLMIAGDCNFEIGRVPVKPGLRAFGTNDPVAWTTNRHGNLLGNIGLADGRVQSATIIKWHYSRDLQLTGLATNRFALP